MWVINSTRQRLCTDSRKSMRVLEIYVLGIFYLSWSWKVLWGSAIAPLICFLQWWKLKWWSEQLELSITKYLDILNDLTISNIWHLWKKRWRNTPYDREAFQKIFLTYCPLSIERTSEKESLDACSQEERTLVFPNWTNYPVLHRAHWKGISWQKWDLMLMQSMNRT